MTPDQLVEFAEGLARIAASGGGPTALAAYLAERTGCGVLVEDLDWRNLATAGSGTMPATARGQSAEGIHTVPIGATPAQVGWLTIVSPNGASSDHHTFARLAASSMAVELARDAGSLRGRRRAFWDRLLSGAYHDTGAAREDALVRGISLAPAYVCIVLESDDADADALTVLRAIMTETFRVEGELALIERGPLLAAFVPAAREVDAANARTAASLLPKTAAKRKSAVRITGGISTSVAPLELGAAFERAQAALTIARRLYGGGTIVAYDELGAYALLYAGAGVEALRAFAQSALAPLRAYDSAHQTELERTLRIYFNSGENVKTTSAELNVHRHTVFYRLRQIADITGRSLESVHDQLTLRLAIAIDALNT